MQYYKDSFHISSISEKDFSYVKKILSDYILFEKSGAGNQQISPIRNSHICWVRNNDLNSLLFEYIKNINIALTWNWNINQFNSLQYTRYKVGHYYDYHTDEGGWVGYKNNMRKISFSLILNDDYEGGEFEIETPFMYDKNFKYNKEFKKLKLESNSLIVFHSDCIHKVHPVIKGVRESLVGWVSGPPFI